MDIPAAGLDPEATYKLITGIIVPRPIAWVTTLSPGGAVNLAPFSAFTFVSNKPPMVGINVGRKAGRLKDTGVNIHAGGEFVVNIADENLIEPVHLSAIEYAPEVSEADLLGLELKASQAVRVPSLAAAPISLECRFHSATAYGETGSEFMVGEVLVFHIRDGLCVNGKIDTAQLRPLCRIGGPNYAKLGEILSMQPIGQTPKTVLGA
ncbi:MAG: flavin reductase family protein [Betaproteobacteria bacterium]|jgi:flavin reductase (DIM6/NTAB) family NADH-FMN oxidoreductase RutF|nr:flavin reductase family protein [Betaproteobacteria bacterium]